MSWVAELKAINHITARLAMKKFGSCSDRPTATSEAATPSCSSTVQRRLVPNMSTIGDHRGLITQGRYSRLV